MSDMCKSSNSHRIRGIESNDQSLEITGAFCYLDDTIGVRRVHLTVL